MRVNKKREGVSSMLYSEEQYIEKLLNENKLHDSEVIGIKLEKSCFQIDVSCKGMDLSYYFDKIEDVVISFKVYGVSKLEFDYLDSNILINQFKISKNDNSIHIVINENDMVVVGEKIEVFCKETQKYDAKNKELDEFLKNS